MKGLLQLSRVVVFCSPNLPRKLQHLTYLKMICLALEFASIIQHPLLLISLKVMSIPPCAVFSWHCLIRSSVKVPYLDNWMTWVKLMFKLLFVSLPLTLRTFFSSTKESSEYNLLFCFSFATFLLLAKPSELNSSANALFCATLISFFPTISISIMPRNCSNVPVCWCSTVVSLLGKAFLK